MSFFFVIAEDSHTEDNDSIGIEEKITKKKKSKKRATSDLEPTEETRVDAGMWEFSISNFRHKNLHPL